MTLLFQHNPHRQALRWVTWQMTTVSAPLAKLAEVSSPATPQAEVDDLDLALLRALATDARQSQRGLARKIEMSPPAVADRLARLERSGAIPRPRGGTGVAPPWLS